MGGRGGGAPAQRKQATMPAVQPQGGVPAAMSAIGQAYQQLAQEPRGWVSLTKLRGALSSQFSRAEVDQALKLLNRMPGNNLAPWSNQKTLSQADRAAMVNIGGQEKLVLSMSNFSAS